MKRQKQLTSETITDITYTAETVSTFINQN